MQFYVVAIHFSGLICISYNLLKIDQTFAISSCSSDDDEKKDSVKEITIYVSSETGESYGFNSTPEECMLVKFDNPNGEWKHLGLYRIEGFTYVKGHEYELRVKMTTLANPPADGYSHKYLLVKIGLRCGSPWIAHQTC